jgi:hypothetical protein
MSERAPAVAAAPAPAPLAKMAREGADTGAGDARIKDRGATIADWIALIRRLRDEGSLPTPPKNSPRFAPRTRPRKIAAARSATGGRRKNSRQ